MLAPLMQRYVLAGPHNLSGLRIPRMTFLDRLNTLMRAPGTDLPSQRDQEVRFSWGHNHDFGDGLVMTGAMGDRHITLLDYFVQHGMLPESLAGKSVLDIGVWTGGTSLMFAAMGASVVAVEEVRLYADVVNLLAEAFAVDIDCLPISLFDLEGTSEFDFVSLLGVLYHVTDPVLALRICFNYLKDGGTLLLETEICSSHNAILAYEGPSVFRGGSAQSCNRRGWNWFIPSISTLTQLLQDVGFSPAELVEVKGTRALVATRRSEHREMCRAGLSNRKAR